MVANRSSSRLCVLTVLIAGVLTLASATPQAHGAIEQRSMDRVRKLLDDKIMGKNILSFVHFGAEYRGQKYLETRAVQTEKGAAVPDDFALVYRFEWDKDGTTELAFLCDHRGN